MEDLDFFNSRRHKLKKVTRRHKGRGGGSIGSLPSTFDTIHLINLIFGTYKELFLYFQISVNTWCIAGFYENHIYINEITWDRHLGFSHFQIFFQIRIERKKKRARKQHLTTGIYKILRSIVKLSVFRRR